MTMILTFSQGKDAFLRSLLQPSFTAVNLAVSTNVWSSLIKRGGSDRRCLLLAYIYLRYFLIVDTFYLRVKTMSITAAFVQHFLWQFPYFLTDSALSALKRKLTEISL